MGAVSTAVKLVHLTTVPQTLAFLTGQADFLRRCGFARVLPEIVHAHTPTGGPLGILATAAALCRRRRNQARAESDGWLGHGRLLLKGLDAVLQDLRSAGTGCRDDFSLIHLQAFYRNKFVAAGDFPVLESASERTIALPFYGQLSDADVFTVCDALAPAMSRRNRLFAQATS